MQPRTNSEHQDQNRTLLNGGTGDFLGLEHELMRTRPPISSPAGSHRLLMPSMPEQEMLGAGEVLQANWPENRANSWTLGREAAPMPIERPSWLLALDDAAVPRARATIEPARAPANASFTEGIPVTQNVAPWFVRSMGIAAAVFFVAVVARTLIAGRETPELTSTAPAQPAAVSLSNASQELAAPDGADARARPGQRPAKTKAQTPVVRAGAGSFLERPATVGGAATPPAPETPALYVYDLSTSPAPAAPDATGTPLGAADVERWLTEQRSSAAPLSDAGAVTRPPSAATAGVASERPASGIWEGATIPVEALSGGLRLETPSVGRVRVRLEGLEPVEGRLTAIGQGRVWVDTAAGPKVIERDALRGLEQIADREPEATAPQAPRRQRVRTAGGVFYGRVLARDGRTVTLITDAGARISVEADELADADPR